MWQSGGGIPGQMDPRMQQISSSGLQQNSQESPHSLIHGDTINKSHQPYDTHTDSGFLSGSNLVSSSSVDVEQFSTDSSEQHGLHDPSTSQNNPTTLSRMNDTQGAATKSEDLINTASCIDSGIDICEQQLSSLLISSNDHDASAQQTSSSMENTEEDLSPHMAILREIFTRDEDGDTQLHIAVMSGFIEIVYQVTRLLPDQALLDYPNHTGKTALHLAVCAGIPSVARHLLVCGASPTARDLRGNTPLHMACMRRDSKMVTQLTLPVIHREVSEAQLLYSPQHTVGLLAADLNNYQGETCVHVAAKAGAMEILQHLTLYGADINAKECRSGRTALHFAVEARDPELVAHVVTNCRAHITAETYGRLSPYQLALANGAVQIATQLLGLGAPAQVLPATYAHESEEEEGEEEDEYESYEPNSQHVAPLSSSTMNGWAEVDDIRLAGVPVAPQPLGPPPVSTAAHTINADLYY